MEDTILNMKCSTDFKEAVRRAAAAKGTGISDFSRQAIASTPEVQRELMLMQDLFNQSPIPSTMQDNAAQPQLALKLKLVFNPDVDSSQAEMILAMIEKYAESSGKCKLLPLIEETIVNP